MNPTLELPLYIILSFVCFFIPGAFVLRILKLNLTKAERFILSWFIGISVFLLINYLFAWISMPFLTLYVLLFLNLIFLLPMIKHRPQLSFKDIEFWPLTIIIFGSIAFSYSMFFSGMLTSQGMRFIATNAVDGIRHIAYIKNMVIFFPPQHPGLQGMELKGFHYFYDFLLSRFVLFFHFSAEDLYFRLFPMLLALLYGAGFYLLSKRMTKSKLTVSIILFMAYFSRSFAFPLVLFFKNINLTDSAVVQPMGLMINPFIVLSIAMLTAALSFLPDIKKSYKYAIIIGLLIGPLSEIKVYAGIIGITAVSFYALYLFIRYRFKYFTSSFLMLFITAIITAVTFFPNNLGQGGFIFVPLEFYRHYIAGNDFINLHWDEQNAIFAQDNNYLRIGILYIKAILIFWVLNLGVRIVVLLKARDLFKKSFWLNDYNFILFIVFLIPIIIGSLFLQSVSVFDIVQFFWIILALLAIPSGIVLGKLLTKNNKVKYLVIGMLILFSIPGNFVFLKMYTPNQNAYFVSNSNLSIYSQIRAKLKVTDFIVYIPHRNPTSKGLYESISPVVSAMLGRSVYLDYGNLPSNLNSVYSIRTAELVKLDDLLVPCKREIAEKEFKQIGTNYLLTENKYSCLGEPLFLTHNVSAENLYFYVIKQDGR
jgi:hypothetical protein